MTYFDYNLNLLTTYDPCSDLLDVLWFDLIYLLRLHLEHLDQVRSFIPWLYLEAPDQVWNCLPWLHLKPLDCSG